MIVCAIIAVVISIISLIIIRYTAGIFVWITILAFLISLFVLGYFAMSESNKLADIAAEENFEDSDNNTYYNS